MKLRSAFAGIVLAFSIPHVSSTIRTNSPNTPPALRAVGLTNNDFSLDELIFQQGLVRGERITGKYDLWYNDLENLSKGHIDMQDPKSLIQTESSHLQKKDDGSLNISDKGAVGLGQLTRKGAQECARAMYDYSTRRPYLADDEWIVHGIMMRFIARHYDKISWNEKRLAFGKLKPEEIATVDRQLHRDAVTDRIMQMVSENKFTNLSFSLAYYSKIDLIDARRAAHDFNIPYTPIITKVMYNAGPQKVRNAMAQHGDMYLQHLGDEPKQHAIKSYLYTLKQKSTPNNT